MKIFTRLFTLILFCWSTGTASAQRYSRFAEHPSERRALAVQLQQEAKTNKQQALAWAKAHGKPVRFKQRGVSYELTALENGRPLYLMTHNANAAISSATDLVHPPTVYGLDGEGVIVGIWDNGSVLKTHREFGDRVTVKDGTTSSGDHATHVGGTVGASGVDASAKGMAPAVMLYSYSWDSGEGEMTEAAASYPGEFEKIYLSNHSYGFARGWSNNESGEWVFLGHDAFGMYNSNAQNVDQIVYGHQYYLPFFSAGNDRNDPGDATNPGDGVYKDGFDCIADYGISKNVMTVGAVNDAVSGGVRNPSGATMSAFSSWGPADDGRIKPDIVANGVGLKSTSDAGNVNYTSMSGTSMSSPSACGSAALLIDYYDDRFPGGAMRASTLKGLIIHTADDLGRPGPDYSYGWGLMNTLSAVELIESPADGNALRLQENRLHSTTNKSDSMSVFIDGSEDLRVTICWTDPAGQEDSSSDNRNADLVNDLDLRVIGPGGTTYYPYKLDYNDPVANATTNGQNNIDNVEQVFVASPPPGEYTVIVDYDGVLTDGEDVVEEQWYSMLLSGIATDSDFDALPDYWELQYFQSPTGALAMADPDGDGANNWTEYVTGHNPTNPDSVFKLAAFEVPAATGDGFVIQWPTTPGRTYEVRHTANLVYTPFTGISGGLSDAVNSYTDTVERAGANQFYRVDVKLGQ
jgi:hypothetical protein